ncbi:MAG: hypothetical protein AAFX08_02080 [Pseudomonadota bacterium]
MAQRGLNFETVGSIVAMVVGLSALFVAWDQAQIMRKQQHASVIPIVNVAGGFSSAADENVMTISIQNDGIGPALVESAQLVVAGAAVSDWSDLSTRLLPDALRSRLDVSLSSAIGVLAAGERLDVLIARWPRDPALEAAFRSLQADVYSSMGKTTDFGVCYCSVFDKCWRTNSTGAARPIPVSACDNAGDDVIARLLQTAPQFSGAAVVDSSDAESGDADPTAAPGGP